MEIKKKKSCVERSKQVTPEMFASTEIMKIQRKYHSKTKLKGKLVEKVKVTIYVQWREKVKRRYDGPEILFLPHVRVWSQWATQTW